LAAGALTRSPRRRRIGQRFELAHSLPKLVQDGGAAPEQSTAMRRGLDALPAAVEQPDAKRVLELGHRLRDGRLREVELCRGARHASLADDGVYSYGS